MGDQSDLPVSNEAYKGTTPHGQQKRPIEELYTGLGTSDGAQKHLLGQNVDRVASFFGRSSFVDSKVLGPDPLDPLAKMATNSTTPDDFTHAKENIEKESTSETPSLNLAFVHMRKAGGTHLLNILNQVVQQHNCTDAEEIIGTSGVRAGIPLDMLRKRNYTDVTVRCPYVNMIHVEMSCIQAENVAQLPRRDEIKNKHFSLFTILRDPIERIGSQANYGKHSVGFIIMNDYLQMYCSEFYKKVVDNFVYENILCETNPGWPQCHCYKKALSKAKNNIATNESMWFQWIHGAIGFDDRYMTNYYIKRLVGGFNEFRRKTTKNTSIDINCFKQEQCFKENGYITMVNILMPNEFCPLYYDKNETEAALEKAKNLLINHYDFMLQERFNDTVSLAAFRRALHIRFTPKSGVMDKVDNKGITTGSRDVNHRKLSSSTLFVSSSSYKNSIPPKVLKYLQRDNAEDIELYNFAVDEFNRRSKIEGW